jgi:NAD dependent epimerase/dehydratase
MSSRFRDRRVLVTGADGFIGSHLTERLVRDGARVRAFCFYNSRSSLGWLDETEPETRSAIDVRLGDIRDSRFVEDALEGIEVVFHLAALVSVPYSYTAPASFVDTNVHGTLNVLEACRKHRSARLVQTSTSEVYGTPDSIPITEAHPLKGQSAYAASKIAADKMCEAFHRTYELPVVTLRPFNTYGPRQSARAVIMAILLQLLRGQKQVELGNVDPKRDLTFVEDTVEGFVAAGTANGVEGRTIQLGTGRAESIREVFQAAARVLGVDAEIVRTEERSRPPDSEVAVLQSNPELAGELLGWKSQVGLEQGLERTAEWLRRNVDDYPARYVV